MLYRLYGKSSSISYIIMMNSLIETYDKEKQEDRGYEFLYIIFDHCITHGKRYDKIIGNLFI